MSSAVITVILLATSDSGVGMRVALTTTMLVSSAAHGTATKTKIGTRSNSRMRAPW